jgi:(R)-2-hydroxyglutarate---pyruvate transhydrogenase
MIKEHDDLKVERMIERCMEDPPTNPNRSDSQGISIGGDECGAGVRDGVMAMDESQAATFWAAREGIPEACVRAVKATGTTSLDDSVAGAMKGKLFKYDVSVPVQSLYDFVKDVRLHLKKEGVYCDDASGIVSHVVGFGHVGDGNLHLNVVVPRSQDITPENGQVDNVTRVQRILEPFVYQLVQRYNGSISAEHGLGQLKNEYLEYSKHSDVVQVMKLVKAVFDPNGIMNPGKYFPK